MAVNNDEPKAQVRAYKDELDLSFEPLLDPGGKTGMLYQVRAFPTSVFVNQHGIIQFVHIGLMTESQMDDYLAEMGLRITSYNVCYTKLLRFRNFGAKLPG